MDQSPLPNFTNLKEVPGGEKHAATFENKIDAPHIGGIQGFYKALF
ncbi:MULTISPECIES: hypothetical protein [Brucella/Ochrobactrum group]|nr:MULTISPECIES: hypothetical protein [Brucella/Ochrobactrum group]MBC8717987.1 hypothetical protein [Ochrobactrum sp. Marseille-Q0166]